VCVIPESLTDDEDFGFMRYPRFTECIFELDKTFNRKTYLGTSRIDHLRMMVLGRLLYECHVHHMLKLRDIKEAELNAQESVAISQSK
jgi:hypothetical protein